MERFKRKTKIFQNKKKTLNAFKTIYFFFNVNLYLDIKNFQKKKKKIREFSFKS